ncbi:MAG: protein-L-isoaspartate O-methyltransferase [Alphaproteobacteria bacterium]|nr:MAG: protein-L-isoaspartate O-methyltransferase [Alphaproteobacteria bacterium]
MNNTSHAQQRANMVEGQLRPHKVNHKPLLERFATLPRERFVANEASAYLDQPAILAKGREAFSPMVAARLVQALAVTGADNVLVVAAGTGYAAAVLAPLCHSVVAVEDDADLAKQAETNFIATGVSNATMVVDNPAHGYQPSAPYSAILIDAPFAELHGSLISQLADGGRLAGVRIGADGIPEATVFTKHGNTLIAEVLFETKGTIHPAFTVSEKFVF